MPDWLKAFDGRALPARQGPLDESPSVSGWGWGHAAGASAAELSVQRRPGLVAYGHESDPVGVRDGGRNLAVVARTVAAPASCGGTRRPAVVRRVADRVAPAGRGDLPCEGHRERDAECFACALLGCADGAAGRTAARLRRNWIPVGTGHGADLVVAGVLAASVAVGLGVYPWVERPLVHHARSRVNLFFFRHPDASLKRSAASGG